jgi:VIT1/CCC1 family predicted Fe2+/Mn2+ transporter
MVLGANDGAISVASLVVGIAASGAARPAILLSGLAATVAGAASMAAGEFVSVQSQVDTEEADLARERQELVANPSGELEELTGIYVERGLSRDLARLVAEQLTLHDALGAHARDELGITDALRARPIQASFASAGSLIVLAALGALAAHAGGAPIWRAAARMLVWGALALGLTALVGRLFGAVV